MTAQKLHITCAMILSMALFASGDIMAQRKKKNGGEEQASGIKLREAEFYFTEGEKFFILEDYAKALLYYQRTLEITPDNATVHYKVAEVLAQSNRQEDLLRASLSIESALKLEKKNKYFYLLAANIYSSLTRFDKAAEAYENLIKEVPDTEEYFYDLAAVYQYANRFEDAIKTYNRAEAVLGVTEISSVQKQRLYLQQGKIKEALAEGEKLITAFPGEERYSMGFAELLAQKNLRDEAIQHLEKFIAQNPDAGNAKMLLAGFYRDAQQEAKARPLLLSLFDDPSVEIGSKLIVMGTYNAEINQRKSRTGETDADLVSYAFSLFEKLEKNYPTESGVHIVGGDLNLAVGKARDAQKEYLKAIELGDVNFEVWENLLYLETQLDQWDAVIRHADQALEIFPNQAMIHYFSGNAHIRKRHYPEAIAALQQSKRLSASNPAVLSDINGLLGDAYHAAREYDKSDKAYEEALLLTPENSTVLNNYSYYLSLRKVNLEKAEKMASLLIKNNPENATFLDTYAWVLYVRGKFKDARKAIERAIETGKATATHFEHYGDILFQLGDVNGAVQQWEKARGMNADSEILNKKIANRKIYE
ncbi:tetratricopeptide repeat protein [Parachryseolinea silvisoli]|uniref:tetratricopeptide repeat protein n=1 Tax=Parachryseolinea silvisoli TaxID=2873601 RepID=UPI002265D882|nr:tetratricopeptide repeat protein [Parachryseolinea silvisoli]MCD9019575.1 tetratricopeptide repeat protein [Parachryseolinea silvisoli]